MRYLKLTVILFIIFASVNAKGNNFSIKDTTSIHQKENYYSFVIQDSPVGLTTMRQSNQNYLSTYRLLSNELYKNVKPKTGLIIQTLVELLSYPLTHEEGHRSILTSLGIGSISQPLYNLQGVAYVNGVRDAELQNLRDNNLPNYIRLHTSGIESDYMIGNTAEKLIVFNLDSRRNLFVEVYFRKLLTMAYYTSSLLPALMPDIKENSNELLNDIVGHDVYGAIKNLHRPKEPFYRYTNYDDLTKEELYFIKRVGYRALINVASPIFFKKLILVNKPQVKLSLSAGYTMSPFGDFIDENIYLMLKNKYKIHAYLRHFENKQTWFPAGGISLTDYKFSSKFSTDVATHVWSQPENMDFNTTKSVFGGAVDILLKYKILNLHAGNTMSLDLGLIYKTKGFLPEEVQLNEHFGVRLGLTLNLLKK
jgi:hypothetical protein